MHVEHHELVLRRSGFLRAVAGLLTAAIGRVAMPGLRLLFYCHADAAALEHQVIGRSLQRVREHLVRFVDLLEQAQRILRAVFVGMKQHGQASVGPFDFIRIGQPADAKYLVIVFQESVGIKKPRYPKDNAVIRTFVRRVSA